MHGEKTFVKVYRYRIRPEQTEQCLALQDRAHKLYSELIHYHVVHLRNRENPSEWLEIHWYPDEETYRHGMELLATRPEAAELWREFQSMLEPPEQGIVPEYFERLRYSGPDTHRCAPVSSASA